MTIAQFRIFLAVNKCYLTFSVYSNLQYKFQISLGARPQIKCKSKYPQADAVLQMKFKYTALLINILKLPIGLQIE